MRRQSSNISFKYDKEVLKEKLFPELLIIMKKQSRSISDNKFIENFLTNIMDLNEITKNHSEINDHLLAKISQNIKYEKVQKNKILFRFGEEGQKFYIILKGKVAVVIPKQKMIEMSEEEYLIYLANLKRENEYGIFEKCINNNNHTYNIDENINFENYLTNHNINKTTVNNHRKVAFKSIMNKQPSSTKKKLSILDELQFYENIKYYDTYDICKNINSLEDYISKINPLNYLNNVQRLPIKVWYYNYVTSLNTGEKFGEQALQVARGKRTATLITLEECHFGTLDRNTYEECLKDIYEKSKKDVINFFTSTPVFKEYNKLLFSKYIMNFFTKEKVKNNQIIINEGSECKEIYFLREGIFEIKMRRSLVEINAIVKNLIGECVDLKDDSDKMKGKIKF